MRACSQLHAECHRQDAGTRFPLPIRRVDEAGAISGCWDCQIASTAEEKLWPALTGGLPAYGFWVFSSRISSIPPSLHPRIASLQGRIIRQQDWTWTAADRLLHIRAMTIVTTHYRYKRPPRKRKAVALEVPAIVTKRGTKRLPAAKADATQTRTASRRSSPQAKASGRFGDVPDMTPEEHKRRGDAADALFREMKREIAEKLREE